MFAVTPNPTFLATAKVRVPTDDGHVTQELRARFRFRNDDEVPQLTGRNGGVDFLREVTVELMDLVDDKGAPVAFTPDLFEQLLKLPYLRTGLIAAYFAAQNGHVLGN